MFPRTSRLAARPLVSGVGNLSIRAAKAPAVEAEGPPRHLTLAEPTVLDIRAAEAAGEDGQPKLPTFSMVAHTFRPVSLAGWFYPVVVDAAGLSIPTQTRPIRYGHDPNMGVGHTTKIAVEGGKLVADGVISRDTESARDVVGSAKNGFPWQASIGASVEEYEFIRENQKAVVNGKEYTGPINVARKTTLNEISFVDLGADDRTKARVAASGGGTQGGKDDGGDDGPPIDDAEATMQSIRRAKAERQRQQAIHAMVEDALEERGVDEDAIEALAQKALDEKWSVKDAQIAILRATRARPPAGAARKPEQPTGRVLEAGLCMACGIPGEVLAKDRDYGPDVVNAAWPNRNYGLAGTIAAALEAMGVRVPHGREALFKAARDASRGGSPQIQAQVFSTVNLPGVLGNVANKILLNAFTAVDAIYPLIADQADFTNFHTHTIYRLGVNGDFEQVGSGGELKHADLSEDTYTNKLATRGTILALTREMIINDDLNAFRSLTAQLARKARIAVEKALCNAIMESVDSFYTAGRGNKLTSNGLAIDKLGAAEAALLGMVDGAGDPIYAMGKYLLVPPGLKYLAEQIFVSTTLATASATIPTDNPFRGRFQVVTSPFLAAAALDGYSATTWYLLADPAAVAAFQVAYLDGRRAPTIETADTEFDTLGMQMRCYFDFGVAQLDYRGAIKSVA